MVTKSELLQQLRKRVISLDPVLLRIAEKMKTQVDFNFRRGQDPDGNKWKSLKYREGQPLRDTGRLQRSITRRTEKNAAIVGTNTKYAPTHQHGAKKGQYAKGLQGTSLKSKRHWKIDVPFGDVPARKFFGISRERKAQYYKMILQYIRKGELNV